MTEIVAWVATPWALARADAPLLAGISLLLLIGLPAVFATPGDKVKVVVPVSGRVTIGLVVLQLVAAVVSAWAVWPVPVAVVVSLLVGSTIYTEAPRWRRLSGDGPVVPWPLYLVNEGFTVVLVLLTLAVLAWQGAEIGRGLVVHLLLGIGLPLVGAVLWGLIVWDLAAIQNTVKLTPARVLVVKTIFFGSAAVCLDALGHGALAIAFGVIAAANTVIAGGRLGR